MKIKSWFAGLALCAVAGMSGGCATIVGGTREDVEIESRPSGASVYVNGDFVGYTPCEVEMDQQQPQYVVLKHDGYADTQVQIEQGTSWMLAWNAVWGPYGLLWLLIDWRAGAEKDFCEDEIFVPLLSPEETERRLYDGNVLLTNVSAKQ